MRTKRFLLATGLLLLFLVPLLTGCRTSEKVTEVPSAAPTTKVPPEDAVTVLLGYSFTEIFPALAGRLVGAVLLGVGVAMGVATFHVFGDSSLERRPSRAKLVLLGTSIFVVTFLLLGGVKALPGALVTVPVGRVGVVLRMGEPTDRVLQPGTHRITPWFEQVAAISTREFTYITTSHVDTASEDFVDYKVGARTCDGVEVQIPYTVKFKVNPERAREVYVRYGSVVAAEERVVKAVSRQIVREVPTNFSSVAMYASTAILEDPDLIMEAQLRELLTQIPCGDTSLGFEDLNESIRGELQEEFTSAGLELTFFGIRQPDLGAYGEKLDEIRMAAKDVELAEINAERAKADKERQINEAEGAAEAAKVATVTAAEAAADAAKAAAEGDAAAVRINADAAAYALTTEAVADAEATLARATSQAEANRLLSASLTPELVTYQVQLALAEKWGGEVPMYSGTGEIIPILPLDGLGGMVE